MDNIRRNISQAEVDEQGHDFENTTILQTRLETYQNRFQGLAVEIPEFDPQIDRHKRNAVLKYNTVQKKWTCQLCSESFSDEQAQWARMLKVKDDLILPIWDSLWLEKHDERNRIIREKETELRGNVEEESKLLRDEAKLFTEEFRPVRDQLESMGSGSRVARQQIDMMLNFYMIRGIMSEQVAQEMRQYMNLANGRTTEDVIELTRQLEAQLADDAEIVALNRHQLSDYADEVRNATKYFTTIEPLKTLTQKQDS